ncbi:MAG: PQQ-binding-like beta-propeller repeat protein [Acidobacteria bacterium]|nr:PQQ-binding-like beta-propeller repeat protein [Acidobacteriota bacterium]
MGTTTTMCMVSTLLLVVGAMPTPVSGQPADRPTEAPQAQWAQWAKFRGPDDGAVSDDPRLPDVWSETSNVVWKADVPGLGWSSPVVWDEHVFLTTSVSAGEEREPVRGLYDPGAASGATRSTASHRWLVYDLDFETGAVRWIREVAVAVPEIERHLKNSFASETPVTDGDRVYVYFGTIGLVVALDLTGEVAWRRELGVFNGRQRFGTAASPALHDGRLYVVNDNTSGSFLVALDAATGDEIWRVERDEVENWATPFVWENDLRTEVVTAGLRRVRSYDLDGRLLWELGGMTVNVVPTPFARDGLVYISSGYPGGMPRPVYAIRPGASGDISLSPGQNGNDFIVWYQPMLGTYNTSALVYDGYYYTLLDRGFLLNHDARTGREVYGRTRIKPGSGFTASPWAYNDRIFLMSEDGETFVIRAGPEFELLHTNSLNEMALATPAVVRGSVLLRTQTKLYRISSDGRR